MKNKLFSGALFAENLKRCIGLIIVGFLVMFVSAPFELLTQAKDPHYNSYFVRNMLLDQNVGFVFIQLALPICAAVAVFNYLYRVNSTSAVHAMPFTRTKLYVTNYISGFAIAFIPQILNWLLLIALRKPTFYSYADLKTATPGSENLYTFAACCEWLLYAFVIVLFTYSVAVIACMVSGNGVIATLTGGAFNVLVGALTLIFLGYVVTNCWGVDDSSALMDTIFRTHPVFQVLIQSIELKDIIIFLLISVALAIAGRYIYYLRKLERCGDSYVFTIMQDVIGFIFVLGASSATGLLLFEGLGFTAYLIGGLIGFVIGQMITRKTFRLWNKKTLKNFIIFFVLMVLIVCSFMFDIFGIEKRVPNEDKIELIEYSDSFMAYDGTYENVTSDNPEVMAAITGLHKDIVANIAEFKPMYRFYDTNSIRIKYYMKNGGVIERHYELPNSFLAENKNIEKLIELSGTKERAENLKKLGTDNLSVDINFNRLFNFDSYVANGIELTDAQKQALLNALSEDLKNSLVNDRLIDMTDIMSIRLEKTVPVAELEKKLGKDERADSYFNKYLGFNGYYETEFGKEGVAEFGYSINVSYKNTLKLLEEISGKSLQEMIMPDDCFAIIGAYGDFVWKFMDTYRDNDGYFRNIPKTGDDFIRIDDKDTVYRVVVSGNERYGSDRLWLSVMQNESNGSVPAYQEVWTSWIPADSMPAAYSAQVKKLLEMQSKEYEY